MGTIVNWQLRATIFFEFVFKVLLFKSIQPLVYITNSKRGEIMIPTLKKKCQSVYDHLYLHFGIVGLMILLICLWACFQVYLQFNLAQDLFHTYSSPESTTQTEPITQTQAKTIYISHQNDPVLLAKAIIPETLQLDPVIVNLIINAAIKHGTKFDIPPALVISIIKQESMFNSLAKSSKGAGGLMQIMFEIHKAKLKEMNITKQEAMHVSNNIYLGCWILKEYRDREKSIAGALKRYVGGNQKGYLANILTTYADINMAIYTSCQPVSKTLATHVPVPNHNSKIVLATK
jgi:hypothetical protein